MHQILPFSAHRVKGAVSHEMLKPFKTGISKPKPKPVRNFTGCPMYPGLHCVISLTIYSCNRL